MRIGLGEAGELDEAKGLVDPRAPAFQQALGFEAERDIVPDIAPGKQRRILKHDDARGIRPEDRLAFDYEFALARRLQQRDELAPLHSQMNAIENGKRCAFEIEAMADAAKFEIGPHGALDRGE